MPPNDSPLDLMLYGAIAVILLAISFLMVVEGWRRWSSARQLKRHFRDN
jgi:ABC-type proline/glycine betaine transport system permease subunit